MPVEIVIFIIRKSSFNSGKADVIGGAISLKFQHYVRQYKNTLYKRDPWNVPGRVRVVRKELNESHRRANAQLFPSTFKGDIIIVVIQNLYQTGFNHPMGAAMFLVTGMDSMAACFIQPSFVVRSKMIEGSRMSFLWALLYSNVIKKTSLNH